LPVVPNAPLPPVQRSRKLPAGNPLIKIGLASDMPTVVLPCCESDIRVQIGNEPRPVAIVSPIRVEPAAGAAELGVYRIQVAALRDEGQASGLAQSLSERLGQPADSHFDAGGDLYRVRVGRYETKEAADADLKRLTSLGVTDAWVVSEGAHVSAPALRITQDGESKVYPGRWLAVYTSGDRGIAAEGKRYRGRLLVFLNDRGSLNLIDELPLEEYLRGVVPSEMGPEQYPRIEAIKAQAVAARTYTLRNLGEFAREGYDICATPRCQVYGGIGVEHPVSDRAIVETAGQVLLYNGDLIDALYSSTCGGHTEDVSVMFPFKNDPYLKAVPCVEAGSDSLEGTYPPGEAFPAGLARRLFPPSPGASPEANLEARLEHLGLLAGLAMPEQRLASLDRREVQRFLFSAFDLNLDARLLMAKEDIAYLLQDAPADWLDDDRMRAAYLRKNGLLGGALGTSVADDEQDALLLALAERLQVMRREPVSYLSVADGSMVIRADKEDRVQVLPTSFGTFRRTGDLVSSGPLRLVAGDRLTFYWLGGALAAILQDVDLAGVAFDRSSTYSTWTRFRSDAQIAKQMQARFPGVGFSGQMEILTRGVSGRVGQIRIYGDGTNGGPPSVVVAGLPIRWTLDVPDTLFTMKRLEPPQGEKGWLFVGRGWGHGVGMCQVGAYGMAQRGHSYREILLHYYRGAELARLKPPPVAAPPPPQ
jgi:stage II sporulation protein D